MNSKKNNRQIVFHGPSQKDLNHTLELERVNQALEANLFYRSSVFHLDDKNALAAQNYSTSEKHYNFSRLSCDPFYSSSLFDLVYKIEAKNYLEGGKNSPSGAPLTHLPYTFEKHLPYKFVRFVWIFFMSAVLLGCGSGDDSTNQQNHSLNEDSTFTTNTHQHDFTEPVEKAEGDTVWACSMHPDVRRSEPGNCPKCGMDLVPVPSESSGNKEQTGAGNITAQQMVKLSPQAAALARVETSPVVRQKAVKTKRFPGKIELDERLISSVTAHFPGRIIDLFVDYTGQYIREGQRLATIYSPELVTAQNEFFEAIKFKDSNPQLYDAARRKLELWELPESEINEIENSQTTRNEVTIVSPVSGYVLKRNIARQDHVMEGTVMYKVVDLHQVWLILDAYEQDVAGLMEGDKIHFKVEALPGQHWTAEISFIGPVVESQKRTIRVRAVVENEKEKLKPGMLAHGIVESDLYNGKPVLQVPKSAVLWTGKRSVVYVQHGNQPHFEAREVVLSASLAKHYIIEDGLEEGEKVVTRGTFKIDSAAQLQGRYSMMNRKDDAGSNENQREGGHRH